MARATQRTACCEGSAAGRGAGRISGGQALEAWQVGAEALTCSRFINGLNLAGIEVDRKVLADLAVNEPEAFGAIVATAQGALSTWAGTRIHSESQPFRAVFFVCSFGQVFDDVLIVEDIFHNGTDQGLD